MGAHLNGAETAVVHVLAVVGAVGDGALDGSVGGAGAPVVGTSSVHGVPPVKKKSQAVRPDFIVYRFGGIIRPKAILQRRNK